MKPILAITGWLYSRLYSRGTEVNGVEDVWQWDDLRFFLAAAREGSLSAAARALGLNHVRVGRRIAVLEKQLGARLLNRTPDGLVPTPAGEAILTKCEAIQTAAREVERLVAGQDKRESGLVRITSAVAVAHRVLVPMVAELQTMHPELQINLMTGLLPLDLTRDEADVAVRISQSRPAQQDLICRKLADLAFAIYVSGAYRARHGIPARGAGFAGHELITYQFPQWPKAMGPMFMGESVEGARVSLRTNDQFVRLEATIAGVGISELPCFLGDNAPELARVFPHETPTLRPVWLLMHRDLRRAKRITLVSTAIVKAFERNARLLRHGYLYKTPATPAAAHA